MERHDTFDALAVGATWTSTGRTLTEGDLLQACMSSGDWHPIHADEAYARGTPLGRRIFHGSYGLHIATGMATRFPAFGDDVVGALGFSDWRYLAPLFVGDTVHVEVHITGKRRTSDGRRGVIERQIRLVRHDGEVVQQGTAQMMVRVRAPQESA